MRKTVWCIRQLAIILSICILLVGCATLRYEAPDGTKVVYTRFLTGSDSIRGNLGAGTIESQGQRAIDPAFLELVLRALAK